MRFDIGKLYRVTFGDHVENCREVAVAHVVGRCVERDRRRVVLCAWWYDDADYKDQSTYYTICRSTITECVELKERRQ